MLPARRARWRLVLLGIIFIIISGYISPVRAYINRSEQIASEKVTTDELGRQQQKLQLEKERLQNQAYVEQVARKDLGLVKPGEQSYVLKNLDQVDENAPAETANQERSIFDSISEAVSSLLP